MPSWFFPVKLRIVLGYILVDIDALKLSLYYVVFSIYREARDFKLSKKAKNFVLKFPKTFS